jgi:hypothetical protein
MQGKKGLLGVSLRLFDFRVVGMIQTQPLDGGCDFAPFDRRRCFMVTCVRRAYKEDEGESAVMTEHGHHEETSISTSVEGREREVNVS